MLQEGDVIELKQGHKVYAQVPKHFIYANRKGVYSETDRTEVRIGEPILGFETDFLAGRYVVTKTAMDGGGTGHGQYDTFPDGHHVWCQNMDQPNVTVDFYQTGCFTAMIPDIEPVSKARLRWVAEDENRTFYAKPSGQE